MTVSQATCEVHFSDGKSQIYTLDATDGTEGALLELISGNEIGSAAQGLTVTAVLVNGENQIEYVTLLNEVAVMMFSVGGCASETLQPALSQVPGTKIGLNYSLKVLTNAS